jgi:hypothetical protein
MPRRATIQDPEPITIITIKLFKPINDLPLTHKPLITFEGEVIPMKQTQMIEFFLRKELRHYKLKLAKEGKEGE